MKRTIENIQELYQAMDEYGLKPASSLQTLCVAIFQKGLELSETSVLVKLSTDIVPPSYLSVPAMMAKTVAAKCPYNVVQSYLRGGYIVVRAGDSSVPMTFRAKALASIRDKGSYRAQRDAVPRSYRRRPSLLSGILSTELGQTVCNSCKETTIRWYLADAD